MKWNEKNFIGKKANTDDSKISQFFSLFSVDFSLKKVQEKKKQARALQEKKRKELIESGALTGKEEDAPNLLEEDRDEDVLF